MTFDANSRFQIALIIFMNVDYFLFIKYGQNPVSGKIIVLSHIMDKEIIFTMK